MKFWKKVGDFSVRLIIVFGFGEFVIGGLELLKIDGVGEVDIWWVGSDKWFFKVVKIVFKIILVVERYVF